MDSYSFKKSGFRKAGASSILALASLILGSATLPTPRALAQNISVNGGSIQGTITDVSGASIANATVVISNKETGYTRTLASDGAGYYSLGPLNPGNYQVTVTAPGFQKTVVETVIRTGTATPGSFRLSVGQSSEQVTVNAGAVQVNTDQPGVSGVITSEQIKTLPINGRNFLDLAQLEPGVQLQSGESFDPTKAGFSALAVNGVSGRTTRILLDGQDITDENVGTTIFNVAQGAIGEFQINHSTQDVSGELTSTGQVLVSTGSGTNTYHGQLFYQFQDHSVGFATIQDIDPPFQRNQFGGAIGGPILKDKLFFFADSERIKQDSSAAASLGSAFSENVDPSLGASIQSKFPLLGSPYRETYSTGRLDYNGPFGGHYFARVNYDNNAVSSNAGYTYSTYANRDNTPGIAGGVDFATGRFTHSFRVSYEKFHNMIADQSIGNPSLYNPFSASPVFLVDGAQNLYAGPNLLAPQQTFQSDKQFRYDGAWTHGAHNLRYGVGFNRLLGGGLASFFGLAPEVSINSSTAPSDPALIGDPTQYTTHLVDLGNGQGFFSEKPAFGYPAGGQSDWRFNAYITDSWRVTPKLSLSAGLRYGRDTLRANQDLGVIPCSNIDTSIFPNPPCTGSAPLLDQFAPGMGKQVNQPNLNFAPQVGFVYSPDSKTSVRGGFGVYYDSNVWNNILFDRVNRLQKGLFNDTSNVIRCPSANPVTFPGGVTVSSVNGVSFSQLCSEPISQAAPMWSALQQQYQAAVTAAGPALNPAYVGETLTVNSAFYAPNYVSPYSLQMNLGIQREITPGTVLSVDYIHSATLKIQQTVDVNHDGAARFLNVPAAQAAIATTLASFNATTVDDAIANGASIVDFANNGLDTGNNFLSGHPYTGVGSPQAAFGGANPEVGEGLFNFPSGRSGYDALQVNLRHQKTHPFPGVDAANFEASYSFSRIVTTSKGGSDGFFTNYAWNYDAPTQYIGRANLDSTHQLSFGGSFLMKYGPRIGLIGHFRSANPNNIQLDNLGYDSVFTTDVDGDGSTADLLPGTNPGDFMHSVKPGNLIQKLTAYNSRFAGTPTPAGQALVTAGLLTPAQLGALGAVQQPVYTGAGKIFNNPMFKSIDASASYPIRLKWLGEGRSLEPSVSMYNVGNLANWTGFTNATSNFAINQADAGPDGSGASTYINGDVSGANYYSLKNQNRIQRGSGTYDQGAPRTTEFALKFNF